ncbi:MAG: hypothetical protein HQ538_03225, partial [Parcubacteria group bacterium]|nr:hypothetical protein [Parcubacteria group bacterium]
LYLYANDSYGNTNNTESVTFNIDLTSPTASLGTNPVDTYNSTSQSITFDLSCTDNTDVDTLILYGNWTGSWIANKTNTSAVNNSVWSIQVDDIPEATGHVWGVWCNDSVGNSDWSTNRTFNIDLTFPLIAITIPTATNYTTNISELNYTYTETNVDKCWYSLNNGTTNSSAQTCGTNYTDLVSTENYNTWTVYINDTSGNLNLSKVTFYKDTIAPYFTTLANQTSTVNQSFSYDVNANDDGIGLDVFILNDTSNFIIDSSGIITNSTQLLTENFYTLNLSINDSLGNMNWSIFTINITVDSTPPKVEIISPTPGQTFTISTISFEVRTNEASSCNYTLDSGVTNNSMTANATDTGFTDSQTLSNAVYTAQFYCDDTSNNLNNTENLSFTVSISSGVTLPGGGSVAKRECSQDSDCEEDESCLNHKCVKLFDIKITDFESPVKLGEFFEFTYLVKGMANISGDVEVLFWIEKKGESVTSGSDVIYIGNFEEKIETTKIFLPSTVDSGVYQFFVKINYGGYTVQSHRTIEIEVKEGMAKITSRDREPAKKFLYYILGILALAILIVLVKIIRRSNLIGAIAIWRKKRKLYKLLTKDSRVQRKINFYKKLEKIIKSIKTLNRNSMNYLNNSFKFKVKKKRPEKRYTSEYESEEPFEHPELKDHLHILKKKFAEEMVEEVKQEKPKKLPPEKIPEKKIQIMEKPLYKPIVKEEMQKSPYISKEPQAFKPPKKKPEESFKEKPIEDTSQDIIENMVKKEESKEEFNEEEEEKFN